MAPSHLPNPATLGAEYQFNNPEMAANVQSYLGALDNYSKLAQSYKNQGYSQEDIFARPDVYQAFEAMSDPYNEMERIAKSMGVFSRSEGNSQQNIDDLANYNARINSRTGGDLAPPSYWTGNGQGNKFGTFVKVAAPLALSFLAPGLGTAIGTGLGLTGSMASAVGGGLLGAGTGYLTGGKKGALLGGLAGGVGGYLNGGGYSELFGGTPTGTGFDFSTPDAFGSAARDALGSSTSLSSAGIDNFASGGGLAASGGSGGGFFGLSSGLDGWSPSLSSSFGALGGTAAATPGFFDDPFGYVGNKVGSEFTSFTDNPVGYIGNQIESGVTDMFSPSNLIKSGLKGGLSYALQKDGSGGAEALEGAYNTAANNLSPYTTSGAGAAGLLSSFYGLNGPDARAAAMSNFQTDPGYNFARDQGIKALDASAAARGMLLSGNQQQAVQNYGTGLANQYFQQYLDNLARQQALGVNAQNAANSNIVNAADIYAQNKMNKATNYNTLLDSILGGIF